MAHWAFEFMETGEENPYYPLPFGCRPWWYFPSYSISASLQHCMSWRPIASLILSTARCRLGKAKLHSGFIVLQSSNLCKPKEKIQSIILPTYQITFLSPWILFDYIFFILLSLLLWRLVWSFSFLPSHFFATVIVAFIEPSFQFCNQFVKLSDEQDIHKSQLWIPCSGRRRCTQSRTPNKEEWYMIDSRMRFDLFYRRIKT